MIKFEENYKKHQYEGDVIPYTFISNHFCNYLKWFHSCRLFKEGMHDRNKKISLT